jgi:hypothetical protein
VASHPGTRNSLAAPLRTHKLEPLVSSMRYKTFLYFISCLLILTWFYSLTAGVEGYCRTWSRSVTHILGSTPLKEGSASRRGNTQTLTTDRRPCPQPDFEPAIPACQRPQTHALDGADTGIGHWLVKKVYLMFIIFWDVTPWYFLHF